jgi:hypothetical protein
MAKKEQHINQTTWVKGCASPNPNGRPKGSKNRFSKSIKDEIQRAFNFNIATLRSDLESLEPMDRIKALGILGKYILTEKKKVEKKVKYNQTFEIVFTDEYDNPDEVMEIEAQDENEDD